MSVFTIIKMSNGFYTGEQEALDFRCTVQAGNFISSSLFSSLLDPTKCAGQLREQLERLCEADEANLSNEDIATIQACLDISRDIPLAELFDTTERLSRPPLPDEPFVYLSVLVYRAFLYFHSDNTERLQQVIGKILEIAETMEAGISSPTLNSFPEEWKGLIVPWIRAGCNFVTMKKLYV